MTRRHRRNIEAVAVDAHTTRLDHISSSVASRQTNLLKPIRVILR